jgi:spermidine synthase
MGCFTCHQPATLRAILVPLVILSSLLALPFTRERLGSITEQLSVLGDMVIWFQAISDSMGTTVTQVTIGLVRTLILMILLWEIFVPVGRILGRLMEHHPNTIVAYSINIAGSLAGVVLFVLLSAVSAPPWVWLAISASLLVLYVGPRGDARRTADLTLVCMLLVAGLLVDRGTKAIETVWSPYQKLELMNVQYDQCASRGKCILVNNVGYQGMIDLRPDSPLQALIPDHLKGLSQYDLPTRLKPHPHQVLIVGAGSGNDVAGVLRGGAEQVTAVEIDPVIIDMGQRHHPERPYDASNVRIVNDDARSFFATTDEKFDLIIFGLLDSHTTTAMTNARLDHYVYTRESIERARNLLTDDGVMVLSFEAVKPYIADRMAWSIREVFGHEALTFRVPSGVSGWGGVLFVAGNQQVITSSLQRDTALARQIATWQTEDPVPVTFTTRVTTDDWPYIYLQSARIPTLYYLLAVLMVVLLLYGKLRLRVAGVFGGWQQSHWHFFFLGAAFLLLEVQNISKAAVVLGNTWIVNAVIISGILVMILLANLIAARCPRISLVTVGVLLMTSCLALYTVDLSSFAFLPFGAKAILVGTLTTLPMLFAGIIFIDSFTRVDHRDKALGANLIGSLVGGMLQSLTFVLGIKALLLIVAALYAMALWTRPRARRRTIPQSFETTHSGTPDATFTFEESAEAAELIGCP